MRREPFPILLTLIILTLVFGGWFLARYYGCFHRINSEEIAICGNEAKDTITLRWKSPEYSITGWSTYRHSDDVLHIEVNISRDYATDMILTIDTTKVRYLEIYEKRYLLSEIPLCE